MQVLYKSSVKVSTHASVRRRLYSCIHISERNGFNSRLREEATSRIPKTFSTLESVSTHASVRRRHKVIVKDGVFMGFNSRLREEATGSGVEFSGGREFQLTPP